MTNGTKILVLGATGGIGGEAARQLHDAGWTVRGLSRRPGTEPGIEWLRGDALSAADVARAALGCSVILHAVNPPGYRNWAGTVLPMLDNTLAAAGKTKATVLLPGTVYNFGPETFPLVKEDAPQNPLTRKGAIRAEMEARLRAYAEQGGQAIILRAGDFFGPQPGNNWFSQGMIKAGKPVHRVYTPARPGIGHQWAYLPDVARTMVKLLDMRDRLGAFNNFHMAGHWDADGRQMAAAIGRAVLRHAGYAPKVSAFPWWLVYALSPFITTFREMLEMRYLWRNPLRLDNSRLKAVLGEEPHTPLDRAVEHALLSLNCLRARQPKAGQVFFSP